VWSLSRSDLRPRGFIGAIASVEVSGAALVGVRPYAALDAAGQIRQVTAVGKKSARCL
jgi:hypothetical protein